MIVVKVGGSLYDLPDLKERLNRFLQPLAAKDTVIIVPGGGAIVEMVRVWDRVHSLGDIICNKLALDGMAMAAFMLFSKLDNVHYICSPVDARPTFVNVYSIAHEYFHDQSEPILPENWDVTSDSIAARVAIIENAEQLILLKSMNYPEGMRWQEAADADIVDKHFPIIIKDFHGPVQIVNLRTV